jgi:ATP-GRASP peptide maturase of grasp-with-spasm system
MFRWPHRCRRNISPISKHLNEVVVICIFSAAVDVSTTDVIRWLHHLGINDVIRINAPDANTSQEIRLDFAAGTFYFQADDQRIHLSDIEAVWYRKGFNWLCDQFYPVTVEDHARFSSYLNSKLKSEEATLSAYLHHLIENTVPVLGSAMKGDLNKLLVLHAAKEIGFLIPEFYITNHREGIKQIFQQCPDLITKSMSDGLYLFEEIENNTGYFSYTEKLHQEIIADLPDRISPSFVQQNIDKKFEVRVFFLADQCFSMAILSQSDEQTKTDFRKYNGKKPNRFVPFILPDELDHKIKQLFKRLDLNTGSVDLLVDQQEDFYFLEINPVGQFGMVSLPCNYFLEKKVALNLLAHASTNRTN